jgi:2-amino-4-hydroxy-6-hydroxymethyldihydropteridine diphosphokinase
LTVRTGYLGFGSNVGERAENIAKALELLEGRGVTIEAVSSLYETEPVGEIVEQPDFLNAAARVSTALEPLELLDVCKAVESELGREFGGPRHGPRPIDVDLLLLGDVELEHDRLTLPHAEVTSRLFVLAPLLELDPGLGLTGGAPLSTYAQALRDGPRVERHGVVPRRS